MIILYPLVLRSEPVILIRLKAAKVRRGISLQRLNLMLKSHLNIQRLEHHKFPELLVKLTQKDPEDRYLRIKLFILQISLTAPLSHQSLYLDSGCSRHMTGEK